MLKLLLLFSIVGIATNCKRVDSETKKSLSTKESNHHVISAYFPIFPRWGIPPGSKPGAKHYIGDLEKNFPILGLYGNKSTANQAILEFDFAAMKNAGITAVNIHILENAHINNVMSETLKELLDRIDQVSAKYDLQWTPTFETHERDPRGNAKMVNQIISRYGKKSLMKHNGNPVFFWFLREHNPGEYAHSIELVRKESGRVYIILDAQNCSKGQICQNTNGEGTPSNWFLDNDHVHTNPKMSRVSGFYVWQPLQWALSKDFNKMGAGIKKTVDRSTKLGLIPVVSTLPSFTTLHFNNDQRVFNYERDANHWKRNLETVLKNTNSQTWLYIQAYDEWAEGATLAPERYQGFAFLRALKEQLHKYGWLDDSTPYCRPEFPSNTSIVDPHLYPSCQGFYADNQRILNKAPEGTNVIFHAVIDENKCLRKCLELTDCVAMVWNQAQNGCYLHTGVIKGWRDEDSITRVPSRHYEHADVIGGTSTNVVGLNEDQCWMRCLSTSTCKAMVFHRPFNGCYLKGGDITGMKEMWPEGYTRLRMR